MTLLDEIRAKCSQGLLAGRDTFVIANKVNEGRVKLAKNEVGIGTFLALFENGGDFIAALEQIGATDRNIHYALVLIHDGRLDLGYQKLQDQLSQLAIALPDHADGIGRLKALGYADDHVTEFEVRCACYADHGEWKP